jgi:hypothetical protein
VIFLSGILLCFVDELIVLIRIDLGGAGLVACCDIVYAMNTVKYIFWTLISLANIICCA